MSSASPLTTTFVLPSSEWPATQCGERTTGTHYMQIFLRPRPHTRVRIFVSRGTGVRASLQGNATWRSPLDACAHSRIGAQVCKVASLLSQPVSQDSNKQQTTCPHQVRPRRATAAPPLATATPAVHTQQQQLHRRAGPDPGQICRIETRRCVCTAASRAASRAPSSWTASSIYYAATTDSERI